MARITVEDCIDKFPSRFELVLVASNRARKLHSGENPTVERDNDKNTVIALREIADQKLSVEKLKNDLVEEYQTATSTEDEEIYDNSDLNESEKIENTTLIEETGIQTDEDIKLNPNDEEITDDEKLHDSKSELSEDRE